MKISFNLNKNAVEINTDPSKRLIDLLRDDFDLTGTKEGCGIGECGACTVIMNGQAVNSCLVLAGQVEGSEILTIEGLSENGDLSRLQEIFYEHTAIQCGYCTPGMVMSTKALLMHNPSPTTEEIKTAIAGNICRCSGYTQIISAIQAAAKEGAGNE